MEPETQVAALVRVQRLEILSWIQVLLLRRRRAHTLEDALVVKLVLHQKLELLLGKLSRREQRHLQRRA